MFVFEFLLLVGFRVCCVCGWVAAFFVGLCCFEGGLWVGVVLVMGFVGDAGFSLWGMLLFVGGVVLWYVCGFVGLVGVVLGGVGVGWGGLVVVFGGWLVLWVCAFFVILIGAGCVGLFVFGAVVVFCGVGLFVGVV